MQRTGDSNYLAMGVLVVLAVVGLAAAFFVPNVAAAAKHAESLTAPVRGAWRAIKSDRALRLVIVGQSIFWALASLLGQDLLVYAKVELELGDQMAGVTFAMFGIGVGIGSVAAGRERHPGRSTGHSG